MPLVSMRSLRLSEVMSSSILSMRVMFFSMMSLSLRYIGFASSSAVSWIKPLAWRMAERGLRISCAKLAVSKPKAVSLSVCASAWRSRSARANSISSSVSSWIMGMARTYISVELIGDRLEKDSSGLSRHVLTRPLKKGASSLLSSSEKYCLAWRLCVHTRQS